MSASNTIKIACWRASSDYAKTPSAQLAQLITAPCALKPLTLLDLFTAATQHGASIVELSKIYDSDKLIEHAEGILLERDLAKATAILQIIALRCAWSKATIDAMTAVIAANTLRLVDVVAAELGEVAPQSVSADDVDAALER